MIYMVARHWPQDTSDPRHFFVIFIQEHHATMRQWGWGSYLQ